MKNKTYLLTLLTAAALLPFVAQAKPEGDRPEKGGRMESIDTDGNGEISLEEAEAADATKLVEHFDEIDADGDGNLTKDELKAAQQKRGGKDKRDGLKELDTDDSKSISLAEAEAGDATRMVENFDKLDADGDGEITPEEFKAAREKMGKGKGKGKE